MDEDRARTLLREERQPVEQRKIGVAEHRVMRRATPTIGDSHRMD
jgi:hypothetical protein